ncbi:uncharacterized protein LOC101851313 isoform X2 [Aplysia californica]|uniref:Uncharacterized protein LOC101851313 isoform X2 n=1 Tax=Aplysia californica TaxID=6500 RepID=A0ABM1A0Y9_APLCA|nr:uncharacterized protein LOC101851313 isoform X2 [Aplysia californica]
MSGHINVFKVSQSISLLLAPRLSRVLGPKTCQAVAALLHDLAWLLCCVTAAHASASATLTLAVLPGLASGVMLAVNLTYVANWLPNRVVMVTACVVTAPGIAAIFINKLTSAYVNPRYIKPNVLEDGRIFYEAPDVLDKVPMTFVIVSVVSFCVHLIGISLLSNPPQEVQQVKKETEEIELQELHHRDTTAHTNPTELQHHYKSRSESGMSSLSSLDGKEELKTLDEKGQCQERTCPYSYSSSTETQPLGSGRICEYSSFMTTDLIRDTSNTTETSGNLSSSSFESNTSKSTALTLSILKDCCWKRDERHLFCQLLTKAKSKDSIFSSSMSDLSCSSPFHAIRRETLYVLCFSVLAINNGVLLVSILCGPVAHDWNKNKKESDFSQYLGAMSAFLLTMMESFLVEFSTLGIKKALSLNLALNALLLSFWVFTIRVGEWLFLVWTTVLLGVQKATDFLFPISALRYFGSEYYIMTFGIVMTATILNNTAILTGVDLLYKVANLYVWLGLGSSFLSLSALVVVLVFLK